MTKKNPNKNVEASPDYTNPSHEQYNFGEPLKQAHSRHVASLIGRRYRLTPTYARLVAQHHYGVLQ